MIIFIVIVAVSFLGLGAVAFILLKENKENNISLQNFDPATQEQSPVNTDTFADSDFASDDNFEPIPEEAQLFNDGAKPSKLSGLLEKLTFWKKNTTNDLEATGTERPEGTSTNILLKILGKFKKSKDNDFTASMEEISSASDLSAKGGKYNEDDINSIPQATPFPSLREHLEIEEKKNQPDVGTSSMTTQAVDSKPKEKVNLTQSEQESIDQEINSSLALDELNNKQNKLEQLIKEKNEQLEKTQKALDSEINNRKEFNKVKDLLEKELKDTRDKSKVLQKEVGELQQENQNYKQQITQLEEKNKDLIQKETKNAIQQSSEEPLDKEPVIPVPEETSETETSEKQDIVNAPPEDSNNETSTEETPQENEDDRPEQVNLPKDPLEPSTEATQQQPTTPLPEILEEKTPVAAEAEENQPKEQHLPEEHLREMTVSKDYLETLNDLNNEAPEDFTSEPESTTDNPATNQTEENPDQVDKIDPEKPPTI